MLQESADHPDMALRLRIDLVAARLRRAWGHPFLGARHFMHRFIWAFKARHGLLTDECCFLATAPMDYTCFCNIHRRLPGIRIVADNRRVLRGLRKAGVPATRGLGYGRAIILASYHRIFPEGVKAVQINHGLGLAKAVYYEKPGTHRMDLYLVSGGLAKERFIRSGIEPVIDVGFPKLDPLFDGTLNRREICARLGIRHDRPVILYAPTWGGLSSAPAMLPYLPLLVRDFTVLVKLHDATLPSIIKRYRQTAGIRLIADPDCTPLLYLADLLISDISSIVFEYTLLNRPIILLPPAKEWREKVVESAWWRVGVQTYDLRELPRLAEELLHEDRPDQISCRRDLIARAQIKCDGLAGERAAQAIAAYLEREGISCRR